MSPPWKSTPPSSHGHWSNRENWPRLLAAALTDTTPEERAGLIRDLMRDAAQIERERIAQFVARQGAPKLAEAIRDLGDREC